MKNETINLGNSKLQVPNNKEYKSLVFDFLSGLEIQREVKHLDFTEYRYYIIITITPSSKCDELFNFINSEIHLKNSMFNRSKSFFSMDYLFKPFNRK